PGQAEVVAGPRALLVSEPLSDRDQLLGDAERIARVLAVGGRPVALERIGKRDGVVAATSELDRLRREAPPERARGIVAPRGRRSAPALRSSRSIAMAYSRAASSYACCTAACSAASTE